MNEHEPRIPMKNTNFGNAFINTPVNYTVLIVGSGLLLVGLIFFLMFAEFSEKHVVIGYLNASKGIARVYAKQRGVIIKQYIQQGDTVKLGEPLYLIDTSYDGVRKHQSQDEFTALQKSKRAIDKEINYTLQQRRQLKPLLIKKYISKTLYHENSAKLLSLQNQANRLDMALIKYNQTRSYLIRSPINGVISSVTYLAGQYTSVSKPLLSILPAHTHFIAEIFIPVLKSGFLNIHDVIAIHYDAYPYQHFGAALGVIQNISQSILTDADEEKPVTIGQPYYKVTASLEKQNIMLYGKMRPLQHGMTFSAIISGSKRKVWQWILDPLLPFKKDC